MRDLVRSLKALSDETRLRILNVLLERECCVCEVMQALEISQTRASRNLNILYDAGFLKVRREGLWSIYAVDFDALEDWGMDLIEAVRCGLAGNPLAAADRERLKSAMRAGVCCTPPS